MNNEEKILVLLEQLNSRQDKTEALLEVLVSDVSVLKTDVSVLKTDVSVLKTNVAVLSTDVSVLKTQVAKVEAELADTKHHVILMENDNKLSFGGLFDGHNVLLGYARENRSDIDKMKKELELHDLRIKALDSAKRKTS